MAITVIIPVIEQLKFKFAKVKSYLSCVEGLLGILIQLETSCDSPTDILKPL
jgi:hypothetical protein